MLDCSARLRRASRCWRTDFKYEREIGSPRMRLWMFTISLRSGVGCGFTRICKSVPTERQGQVRKHLGRFESGPLMAADISTGIGYLESVPGNDSDLLNHALSDRRVVMPPAVVAELLSNPKLVFRRRRDTAGFADDRVGAGRRGKTRRLVRESATAPPQGPSGRCSHCTELPRLRRSPHHSKQQLPCFCRCRRTRARNRSLGSGPAGED